MSRPAGSGPAGLSLRAPAKVNLGLRITGRRADGYHLLASLFVPLACPGPLCDEVEVAWSEGGDVELALVGGGDDAVPPGPENLAHRAAAAFREAARLGRGVRVGLRKRIPSGAGLGGGSSDAGAVLRALVALAPGALTELELREVALGLGADVPFFLAPAPAWVTGVGERIEPVPSCPRLPLVVGVPEESLSTADVYKAWSGSPAALTEPGPEPTIRALRGPAAALEDALRNDLEAPARTLCPAVGALLAAVRASGARAAALSGSGPAVYGIFEEERERDEALERLRTRTPARLYAVETVASA